MNNDPTPEGRAVESLGSDSEPTPTSEPSADAKYLADRLHFDGAWTYSDAIALVAGVQAIAGQIESARYDGPDFSIEKVMDDLLGPLRDIAFHLEQISLDEGGDDRIVAVVPLPEPLAEHDRAIVAWAFTRSGGTMPVVSTPDDPTPRVHAHARPTLREVQ